MCLSSFKSFFQGNCAAVKHLCTQCRDKKIPPTEENGAHQETGNCSIYNDDIMSCFFLKKNIQILYLIKLNLLFISYLI